MSIRELLVHVDGSDGSAVRADFAARLAVQHDARLSGIFISEPLSLNPVVDVSAGEEIRKIHRSNMEEGAERARAQFQSAVAGAGAAHAWSVAEGAIDDVLGLRAIYADFAVVGQHDPEREYTPGAARLPEHLTLNVRRPTIIVPYAGDFSGTPRHVMVAWNASPEAARAIDAALPILRKAQKVTVLSIDPVDLGDLPGADIAARLARHDVSVEVDTVITTGAPAEIQGDVLHGPFTRRVASAAARQMPVGETLLSRVSSMNVDMIVMGAFGQSRLRETFFGGASRHILRHMTVPVLMAH